METPDDIISELTRKTLNGELEWNCIDNSTVATSFSYLDFGILFPTPAYGLLVGIDGFYQSFGTPRGAHELFKLVAPDLAKWTGYERCPGSPEAVVTIMKQLRGS